MAARAPPGRSGAEKATPSSSSEEEDGGVDAGAEAEAAAEEGPAEE